MGVFDEGNYPSGQGMKASQECKRDYEAEIARIRSRAQATEKLRQAVEGYVDVNGRGNKPFTLTELYGSLCLETRDFDKAITELQEIWEREK